MTIGFRHEALFYDSPTGFADTLAPFVTDGLATGEPVLVAVRPNNAACLRASLGRAADEVTFIDMPVAGRNPGRIISLWHDFVDIHPDAGAVRGIGEPIWRERTAAELQECQHHEELLNAAFAKANFWLVCPYDSDRLNGDILNAALGSHPYAGIRLPPDDGKPAHEHPVRSGVLSAELPLPVGGLVYATESGGLSPIMIERAVGRAEWLSDDRRMELLDALDRLISTTRGSVRFGVWLDDDQLICAQHDE
mgnify:FL=1